MPYLDSFPYLGLPHQGYEHQHRHGSMSTMMSVGFGLLGGGLLLGSVFAVRQRRNHKTLTD